MTALNVLLLIFAVEWVGCFSLRWVCGQRRFRYSFLSLYKEDFASSCDVPQFQNDSTDMFPPPVTRSRGDGPSEKKDSKAHHYQEVDSRHDEIIDQLIHHYTSTKDENRYRANVQLPPGWGKTQLALRTLVRLRAEIRGIHTVVYVTEYLKLVDQVIEQIERHGAFSETPNRRLIVASQTSLQNETITTSVEEIDEYLSVSSPDQLTFIICTYNSLPRIGEALSGLGTSMSFAVFDEAHKMEGAGSFGYGLDDSNIPIRYRLFMTATPRKYKEDAVQLGVLGSELAEDGSQTVIPVIIDEVDQIARPRSFLDVTLFGPCIVRKTLRESTAENVTVPVTLWAVECDDELATVAVQPSPSNTNKDRFLATAIVSAFQTLNLSRAVAFHSMNYRARNFIQRIQPYFAEKGIAALYINSTMSATEREEVLLASKLAKKSVVSNCRLLSTGVDDAEWEMVVMADPTRSSVSARQIIGRVTRKHPGKHRGYVLLPLFEDDLTLKPGSAGYERFITVYQAMVGLDPELRQEVLLIMSKSERLGRPLREDEYPARFRESIVLPAKMTPLMKEDLLNVAVKEVVRFEEPWDRMFSRLLTYKKRTGDANVPRQYMEDGWKLGAWLMRQRRNYRLGRLPETRKQKLEDVGVAWEVLEEKWNRSFLLLQQFKDREGHCDVPGGHNEGGINLGNWLATQRSSYRAGELDETRKQRLEDAGVQWSYQKDTWRHMYRLLQQYQKREGHCNVPRLHKEENMKLGQWLGQERKLYKAGKLDETRKQRFEDIGVTENVKEDRWNHMFQVLEQFKEREGHCNAPSPCKTDDSGLGQWLVGQRKLYKAGRLDARRKQLLADIGVAWDLSEQKWDTKIRMLRQFVEREGHCDVPCSHKEDGSNLGKWMSEQRSLYNLGKLSEKRQHHLEEVGVVWRPERSIKRKQGVPRQ